MYSKPNSKDEFENKIRFLNDDSRSRGSIRVPVDRSMRSAEPLGSVTATGRTVLSLDALLSMMRPEHCLLNQCP